MSQPKSYADPTGGPSIVVNPVQAKPGEPPVVEEPIPLEDAITLYLHRFLGTTYKDVTIVILFKTARDKGWKKCNGAFYERQQREAIARAQQIAQHDGWEFDDSKNIGRYIMSGVTRPEYASLIVGPHFGPQETGALPKDHGARTDKNNPTFAAAQERLLENRNNFLERTAKEDYERLKELPESVEWSAADLAHWSKVAAGAKIPETK